MKVYLAILSKAFLSEYVYRANVVFTIIRNLLMFFILISVWTALYSGKSSVNSITLSDMITYTLIMIVLRNLMSSKLHDVMNEKINTGSIVSDFIRPVSFMLSSVSQQLGRNLFNVIFATLPILASAMIYFGIGQFHPTRFLFSVITAGFGLVLVMQISWIISLICFWTKSAAFGMFLLKSLMEIFGGMVVPLWFYPDVMRSLCMALPFRLAYYSPASVIMGKTSMNENLHIVALQLMWIALLIALERIVWSRARRIVIVQGG